MCKSSHCHTDKANARSSKSQEIILDGSDDKCKLYTKLMSDEVLVSCYTPHKSGAGGGFALHTCVCSEVLLMQWFHTKREAMSMRKEPNVYFADITKA